VSKLSREEGSPSNWVVELKFASKSEAERAASIFNGELEEQWYYEEDRWDATISFCNAFFIEMLTSSLVIWLLLFENTLSADYLADGEQHS